MIWVYTYANNDPLTAMADDGKIARMCVRMKSNDQLEISLLRIRSALLPHVIAGRFGKV